MIRVWTWSCDYELCGIFSGSKDLHVIQVASSLPIRRRRPEH